MFDAVSKRHLTTLGLVEVLEQCYSTAKRFPIAPATVIFPQVQITPTATNNTAHAVIIQNTVIKPIRTIIITLHNQHLSNNNISANALASISI
jgi:hypothetical protein